MESLDDSRYDMKFVICITKYTLLLLKFYWCIDYMHLYLDMSFRSCGNNNFAWRNSCNRCNTPKPGSEGGDDDDGGNNLNSFEPRHETTNVLVSDLVRHKPGCTATGDG